MVDVLLHLHSAAILLACWLAMNPTLPHSFLVCREGVQVCRIALHEHHILHAVQGGSIAAEPSKDLLGDAGVNVFGAA